MPSYIKVHGEIKEQPLSFLAKLESYFTIKNIPERLKLHITEQEVSGKAHRWWTSLVPEPSCYAEWREKYLRRYWNESRKFDLKYKSIGERYRKGGQESTCDFATRKIAAFKACEEKADTGEIMRIVIRQLPNSIQSCSGIRCQIVLTS